MTRERKIKLSILASGHYHYEVANMLKIAPCTLSLWLRAPMSKEHEEKIRGALQSLREAKNGSVA